ncbi:MAG: hypothetical protein JXO44_04660 [Clostridia bacterium]|nr:hypothetical protein [Clostridia bacterium]
MKQWIKVRTPASCGELIQGFYGKQEMLISYPINLFSEVTFSRGKQSDGEALGWKAEKAVQLFFEETGADRHLLDQYHVTVMNNIPVGKGMASSTADICGVLKGLCHLYELELAEEEVARLCCLVEPTDSTVFQSLTLFDHINGIKMESFDWQLECDVLVLEPDYQINTTDFRRANKEQIMRKNHDSKALELFRAAVEAKCYYKLCESTYLSAKENQEILEKPYLEELYHMALEHNCYGINVAHSGSIVAILFDRNKVDIDALKVALTNNPCGSYYKKRYMAKVIEGGSQILEGKTCL